MLCDIEVQDTPTVVTDDEKAIERAEGDRRNSEEGHRGNRFPVIAEKGKPALGRFRISRCPFHPTRDRSLRDIKTEHEKLALDARLPTLDSQRPSGRSIPELPSTSVVYRRAS